MKENCKEQALLLGIDIGTSACKVALFTLDGQVVAQESADYKVYYPQPGWAEQNPDDWWQAVCQALLTIFKRDKIQGDWIKGIGIDGQSWSAIPVNKAGKVLYNTPIWMDTRAQDICLEIKNTMDEAAIFKLAGNSLQPSYTLPKILWYKKHQPEVYGNTYKILGSNSFIAYRLTGVMSQDLSQGYGYACFNMEKGTWDLPMCEALGVDPAILPEIFPCHQVIGQVTPEAARLTGLTQGTPVVAGGLDAACGTLGAGVIQDGETQEQGGQAGGMSISMSHPQSDPRLILSFHVVPDKWLLQGGTVGGGGVMRWFAEEFAEPEKNLAAQRGTSLFFEMDEEAKAIPAGSDGLVFLPYMAGERSPIWDTKAKGVYYGIDFSKTRAHFIRAAMEGVAFSLKHNLDIAQEAGATVKELRAMGGAANSRLWTQIKADVLGRKILVPASDTATTLGAAILAGVGTGLYADFEEAVQRTVTVKREHTPDKSKEPFYEKNYQLYRQLYEDLKITMHNQ